MQKTTKDLQAKALRKAGRELTRGLALGTRAVPSKRKGEAKRMTTAQWLQGAL